MISFEQFRVLLAENGYQYGRDAAENAYLGYELGLRAAAEKCDQVVGKSNNALFRSGAKICAAQLRDDTGRLTSDYEPSAHEIQVCREAICREFGNNGTDGYYIRILKAVHGAMLSASKPAAPAQIAVVLDDERAAFVKSVQSLAFLCRTETKRLDRETLKALDEVEDHLVAMRVSVRDDEGELRAASPQPVAQPEEQTRALTADWLWSQLIDYCHKQGTAPANNPRLFEIVDNARALTAARPASGE